MALRTLLLRKKIDSKKGLLEKMRGKDASFVTREKELEESINEMNDDTSEEDRKTIEEETETFQTEKAEHENEKKKLEDEISELEKEIQKEEDGAPKPSKEKKEEGTEKRKGTYTMTTRTKFFGMDHQERTAFIQNEHVQTFITNVRTCIKEKRALENIGLTIPDNMLPLIREVTQNNSKLLKYVTHRTLRGTTRQTIMGTNPEGVWTEMYATLNELSLKFNNIEMDGYKVGGFFAVANVTIEDSDLDIISEIMNALGIAIAKALDKAIVYGKGTKMPLGWVTRLAQETKPSDYPVKAREWEDLHTSNIVTITNKKGVPLFQEITKTTNVIDNDFSTGGIVWIMNKKTHNTLVIEAMGTNMNAAIVSGVNSTMPVIGGDIVELNFMNDGDIAFGYADLYALLERKGLQLGQSEHYRFIEEQTIFKGTQRFDGKPVIAEAFGIMNIAGTAPTLTVDFPADDANKVTEAARA